MDGSTKVLIAGSAGFIGSNLMRLLLDLDIEVRGIDNYSSYYDQSMKILREESLGIKGRTTKLDITDRVKLTEFISDYRPNVVINLAAQGGVRASKVQPIPYINDNQMGFLNILEVSREFGVTKFIFASSSSVYGDMLQAPFKETHQLTAPKSLYALSKLSNEIIARHFNAKQMSIIGLRFFTVYGPWSRPDMAMFRMLASARLSQVFNLTAATSVKRDFTYVDDVSQVMHQLLLKDFGFGKYEIFNVCGGKPYSLHDLFEILKSTYREIDYVQMEQDELDVKLTHGSIEKLLNSGLSVPSTSLENGVTQTLDWFNSMSTDNILNWYKYSLTS